MAAACRQPDQSEKQAHRRRLCFSSIQRETNNKRKNAWEQLQLVSIRGSHLDMPIISKRSATIQGRAANQIVSLSDHKSEGSADALCTVRDSITKCVTASAAAASLREICHTTSIQISLIHYYSSIYVITSNVVSIVFIHRE